MSDPLLILLMLGVYLAWLWLWRREQHKARLEEQYDDSALKRLTRRDW